MIDVTTRSFLHLLSVTQMTNEDIESWLLDRIDTQTFLLTQRDLYLVNLM